MQVYKYFTTKLPKVTINKTWKQIFAVVHEVFHRRYRSNQNFLIIVTVSNKANNQCFYLKISTYFLRFVTSKCGKQRISVIESFESQTSTKISYEISKKSQP